MANRNLEIIVKGKTTYGHLDGFLYTVSDYKGDVKYWKCRQKNKCTARLTTITTGRNVLIRKGGSPNTHTHGPDPEEVKALRIMSSIKKAAAEHPERPPTAVMRIAQEADAAVQAQLPERDSIRKIIQRERAKNLPTNPKTMEELKSLPDQFKKNSRRR